MSFILDMLKVAGAKNTLYVLVVISLVYLGHYGTKLYYEEKISSQTTIEAQKEKAVTEAILYIERYYRDITDEQERELARLRKEKADEAISLGKEIRRYKEEIARLRPSDGTTDYRCIDPEWLQLYNWPFISLGRDKPSNTKASSTAIASIR